MSPLMWLVVVAGGIITIGFGAMFPMRRSRTQFLVMSLAAIMFALMTFLLVAMDMPLRGEFSVQPDAFVYVKGNIARLRGETPPRK